MAEDSPPVRRLGYVRVSMAREEMISPAIQRAAILDDAKRTGRQITGWVEDLDATGRNFKRRVMEAIAAIEAGQAAEIGVYRYDRWGRNALECLANVQRVEDAGGAVVSAMERIDVETAMGRFTRRMAFDLAELQSDQIADNWRAAHASRVRRGLPADGTPRFGYVRLGKVRDGTGQAWRRDTADGAGERYEPDPATAPILAGLYERYTAGESVRSLAHWLNSEGITTAAGAQWTRDSLRVMLSSGFGAGLLRVHDPACRCKGPSRGERDCPRTVNLPGAHEPVISRELWDAFLARQEARRDTPVRLRDPVYPYSGLLTCGATGHRLTVTSDSRGVAYRCPRRAEGRGCEGAYVREVVVEEAILSWLSRWARDIEAAAVVEAARLRATTRAQVTGDALAKQEATLERQLARLMRRWAADDHAEPKAYEIAYKGIEADLEAVRGRMRDAQRARAANAGAYQPVMVGLIEGWPTFPPARRREMLSHLIARVEVYRTGSRKPARLEIIPVWEETP